VALLHKRRIHGYRDKTLRVVALRYTRHSRVRGNLATNHEIVGIPKAISGSDESESCDGGVVGIVGAVQDPRVRGDDVRKGGDDVRKGGDDVEKSSCDVERGGKRQKFALSEALHQFEDGLGMAFGFYLVIDLDQLALFVDYKCRATDTHVGFTHELALAPGAIKLA